MKDIFEDLVIRKGLIGGGNQLQLFKNIRFTMYPARAFSFLLQKLYEDNDLKYIRKLGKKMGRVSSENFKKEIAKMKRLLKKEYQTLPALIELSGFGKIHSFKENKKEIILQIKEHPVITPSKEIYGKKSIACSFYSQIYAEYIKTFRDLNNVQISHNKCLCNGDKLCEWRFKWE